MFYYLGLLFFTLFIQLVNAKKTILPIDINSLSSYTQWNTINELYLKDKLADVSVMASTTITNTGTSDIDGDLFLSPGTSLTGVLPSYVRGKIQIANEIAIDAQVSAAIVSIKLRILPCDFTFGSIDIGGRTLGPGVYCFESSVFITGILTLDSQYQSAPFWVLNIGSTLVTAGNSNVIFINGNAPCNVVWNVGSSATLGHNSIIVGNILASASITGNIEAFITGKLIARRAAITLIQNKILNCIQ